MRHLETLLEEGLNWVVLEELLARHRVLALFVLNLRAAGLWELVPRKRRGILENRLRSNQFRQLAAIRDLIEVAKSLSERRIESICLKGPTLGVLLYKDPLLRHYSDLDILVRRKDVSDTVAILLRLGFRLSDLHDIQTREDSDPMWKHLYHVHLERGSLTLELHWRLSRNDRLYNYPIEQLFTEKQKIHLGGGVLYTLSNVHLQDYIALHGASHCWNRLKWLHDAKLICSQAEDFIEDRPQTEAVRLMYSLSHRLWQQDFLQPMQSSQCRITSLCFRQLVSPEEHPRAISNMLRRTWVLALLCPSLSAKLAYLSGIFVWPDVYQRIRLPRALSPLYYFLGPIFWAISQVRLLASRAFDSIQLRGGR
ncbi:nucleotidyltransferase family protein [Pelagicoccus sp. SDUM812002]|uniref:nucleotidyltransferase domain-containing protein n=1 Tax=Pelagicoccus sp. SDUM812002 TaxID=3041266 RepID=UPI0034E2620F